MKKMMNFWVGAMIVFVVQSQSAIAQKIDEDRMVRDIEVAENVLSTMCKQEIAQQRTFFGMDIKGTYQPGYGVTFRLPGDYSMPMVYTIVDERNNVVTENFKGPEPTIAIARDREERESYESKHNDAYKLKDKMKEKRRYSQDSVRDDYNKKLIKAAKDFVVDYGDFISQLGPNERVVVTNRGENRSWYFKDNKRTHLSVEGLKSDITAYKQGKITRDQAIAKLKIVNTEYVEEKEADMELFTSIFNRLYRSDLSKTFFSENNVYYERLKDYGVIYYMQVYSSSNINTYGDTKKHTMPTIGMEDVDQSTRDKKVVELYPKFEKDMQENILEYGRTLKTLGDEELLVFNITLTKCEGCGIPSTLELTVKASVLKEYGMGKVDMPTAVSKFTVKKGASQ